MLIHLLKDEDPLGGYFCAEQDKPDMTIQRPSVVEVRSVEVPDDVWELVLEGGLPVDPDYSNDSTWAQWWPLGTTVWTK
jgi:hypothetical protein